ncbi:MAG TPA: RsmE family RNA methyltransferase [bacterium]|nr:RsmE family RNA methyltransferase [bacterium]
MPQFFVDRDFCVGDEVALTGADARHVSQSLRLGVGDWLVLSDGRGSSFRSEILSASPGRVTAKVLEEMPRPALSPPPALALAVIKGDRFEWALGKCVELGCRRILPFFSSRTVPQYSRGADVRKLTRWRKIALEAAIQSGLPFRPEVEKPAAFGEMVAGFGRFDRAILFYEGERGRDVRSHFSEGEGRKVSAVDLLIIGPEGGFSKEEVDLAREAGAVSLCLGSQILRVETAAVVAVALWQYELGNMDAI